MIGSVGGNMGNAEVTMTLVSLVKAIIAFETGSIPPTIHFKSPNPNVPALVNNGLKVSFLICNKTKNMLSNLIE